MKLKNLLLSLPFQLPLSVVLIFGVHYITELNLWWCLLISSFLTFMYDIGEIVRREDL